MGPKPVQKPHPPVWLVAGHPHARRRAAAIGDWWMGAGGASTEGFFWQAEDGIRAADVTGVQTCALPIFRDRNRPSVIIWGTRVNETIGHVDLYRRTVDLARELDGTRQTTGAMRVHSAVDW